MTSFLDQILGSLPSGTQLGDVIFYNTFEVVRYITGCVLIVFSIAFVGYLAILLIKSLLRGKRGG